MAFYGPLWPSMALHGPLWPSMALYGPLWPSVALRAGEVDADDDWCRHESSLTSQQLSDQI
jgi:hypothetical protein